MLTIHFGIRICVSISRIFREYQHCARTREKKSYRVRHRTHVSSARRMIRAMCISTLRACIAERNIRSRRDRAWHDQTAVP